MTTHELANKLREMPNVKIVGIQVGQGSCEGNNEFLTSAFIAPIGYLKEKQGEDRLWLSFGDAEPVENPAQIKRFRDSGWLTDA